MTDIFRKLTHIQEVVKCEKTKWNGFSNFPYRSLEDIQDAVKPLLSANGLALVLSDEMVMFGDRFYIKATAELYDIAKPEESLKTSGWARETEQKKGFDESQLTGSASTYARKKALDGMFLLDDTPDADSQDNTKPQGTDNKNTKQDKSDDKPWYNDFDKHKSKMIERINDGESAQQILDSIKQKFKVNKEVQQKILGLGKGA